VRWKTFTLFCGKFILGTMQQILSESAKFYRRHDRNILAYFIVGHGIKILAKHNFKFHKVV